MAGKTSERNKMRLPLGSVSLMASALTQQGFSDDPRHLYRAGQLLEQLDYVLESSERPEQPDLSEEMPRAQAEAVRKQYAEKNKKWIDREVDIDITEKQRETVKGCLEHLCKQRVLTAGRPLNGLIDAFGLIEE